MRLKILYSLILALLFTCGAWAACGADSEEKFKPDLLRIADAYVRNVLKWRPNSYELSIKGHWKDNTYVVSAFKVEDILRVQAIMREAAGSKLNICYFPEFIFIDMDTREVIDKPAQFAPKNTTP